MEQNNDDGDIGVSPLCRAFLRQEYDTVHPRLNDWLKMLSDVGASECWHKKSTFKAHLFETYKMCKLWGFSDLLSETMLFHSAYSNSYVNLAIFKAATDRPKLATLVGPEVEALVHLFCVVPRHDLIYEKLLKVLPDDRLIIPEEGVTVSHIHTGQPLLLSRKVVAAFLALTMVDFSEQLMSWQDTIFENHDGKLYYAGTTAHVLWPAAMQPGLYHAALSRMGRLLRNTMDDIKAKEQQQNGTTTTPATNSLQGDHGTAVEDIQITIPAVYNSCSVLVDPAQERQCRDLYWQAVTTKSEPCHAEEAERLLTQAIQLNPFVAEPHLLLAQLMLQSGRYQEAHMHATAGLDLLCQWGTAWDKRMAWDAWVAWARVLLRGASIQQFPSPDKPMGMLNLGIVEGI